MVGCCQCEVGALTGRACLPPEWTRQQERMLLASVTIWEKGTGSCAGPCGLWSGCLCGLCCPPWGRGRGWTPLGPLLRDGKERRGKLRETGTAHHPDHRCPLWQEPGPRELSLGSVSPLWPKRAPCWLQWGSSRPLWPHLLLRALCQGVCVVGGGTTRTLSKAAMLNSASRRLQLGHILPFPSAGRVGPQRSWQQTGV